MEADNVHEQPRRKGTRLIIRLGVRAVIAALFLLAALLGTLSGLWFAYSDDLDVIRALDNYRPPTITRLSARDGQVIGEFATQRRVVVGFDQMAPALRQAIIASEDAEFEQHFGLSISRILVTVVKDIVLQQRYGASTITQQVARNLFLQAEYMRRGGVYARTGYEGLERKVKEMLLAIQLERRFTKPEIFAFYANQVPLGHGAYGVEAGARLYFDKAAKDLTLEEAATIAAIVQTPARLSPYVNPERTLARRNSYVLPRMVAEGFITQREAEAAARRPIVVRGQPTPDRSVAPYFVEEIRKSLEETYGVDALYQGGLQVRTTLDVQLQRAANAAIERGLRQLDKRRGYRKPARNVIAEGLTVAGFTIDRWKLPITAGDIVPAVVTTIPRTPAGPARVRIGRHEVELPRAGFAWTGRGAADLFAVGDVIDVAVRTLDGIRPGTVALEQAPRMEAALVAIDNRTGEVLAMIGGLDFTRSKFNRATQARRQVGSLFKPIVYTAALERGFTPISVFVDEPTEFDAGAGQPPYRPLNYDRKFEGPMTLRRALEQSRNIPAVKAMREIGPDQVVGYARRFGFQGNYPPYLSLALGAAEATLIEMTSAYSAFANQGIRMTPLSVVTITDREGNIVEEHRSEPHEALRGDSAYVMTNLLQGVVQHGTAGAARALEWPVAGKTGTVDNFTDAWFVGFDPTITVGVWVGYDEKRSLGAGEGGASSALPIWIDFMKTYIAARGDRANPPAFQPPGNIVFVTLESGMTEAFINGTQPASALTGDAVPASIPVNP